MTPHREVRQTLCRMCEDRCGIEVHLEDGRVVEVTGNKAHPANEGRLCPKGRGTGDMVHHPDRLRAPLKRVDGGWERIALATALDEIAERVQEISREHGPRSIAVWKGEAVGFAQQEALARRFIHAFGSPNYLSNDSMCFAARYCGYTLVDGEYPVADVENAEVVLVWGANPPHAHPTLMRHITAARRRGARLIVVDPRRSTIARQADVHVAPRPATDGALAWGLIRELIASGGYDADFVEARTVGFPEVRDYAEAFTPEAVEAEADVPASVVREVARLLAAAAPRVALYAGNGLEHHENAVDTIRTILLLDGLLGTLGREGGSYFAPSPGLRDLTLYDERPLRELGPLGADRFPVLYDLRQECHTMTAMGAILEDTPYPLRAIVLTAANPLMTNPNSVRVREAFEALDLLVVRDLFMSETAALADYVLPAASFLERTELHTHPRHEVLTLTDRILAYPEVQSEYDFWHDLAHRLGIGEFFPWPDETALNRWLLEPTGVALEELAAHPEGVRYTDGDGGADGAPHGHRTFATPSGRVEFTSAYLAGLGYDPLPRYRPPAYRSDFDPAYPLVLMTGARKLRFMHSRFRNIDRFRDAEAGPEVEVHPDDAAAMGIGDGDTVRIVSPVGSLAVQARVVDADAIRPGELQLTHGWSEANVNLLTSDLAVDPISGFPLLKGVAVRLERP